jgi:RHS repeat-associated protein
VTYHYDDLGNLTSYQDQGANTTSLAYDSRGMLRAISDPDLCNRPDHRSRTFSYDKNGRLLSALDSKDQTVHLTRDELGRVINRQLLSKESLELESDVFEYDDGPGAAGNLSRYQNVTNALFSRLDRDYWGRPLTETKAFGEEEYKTETVFDLLGRPTKITYPSGETVNYAYHPAVGLTDRITWRDPANSWDNIILHEIKYDPVFRPVFYGIGSGFVYRGYDPAFQKLRMQEIHTKTASLKFEYRYYPDGNMERGGDIAGNVGWKYAYDYAGRLGAAKKEEGGNLLFAADYSYEPNGNIQSFTRRTSADPAPKTFHYGYGIGAGPHAVTGISGATAKTLNYDENGMVVKGPDGETYKYDGEGRLSGVMKDKCNIGFTFDAFGGRAVRNVRCVETAQTLYVGPHYEVTKESGVVHRERYVLLNGKRMVYLTDKNPGKFFHLVDSPLGTPHVVVDGSQFTGTDMFITRDYEPFGTLNESSGIDPGLRYGFTGQEEDPTTGLLHLGAREYAPPLMRMIQPDPIVPNLANPQSLNRYSYAYNNPARYTDVSGYSPEDRDFLSWDAPSDQFWENFDDRYDPPLPPLVTIPSRIPLKSADGLAAKSPGKHPAIDAITFESVPGPYKSDGFDTAEKAAVAAINEVNPRSIAQNREFGGCVYFDSSTNLFYYTEALMGDADSTYVGTIPNGMEHAGYYHTHAGPTGLAWQFSPADQKIARGMKTSVSPKGVPIYVGTPTGVIFVYTPNGKGSTESDFKKIQWPNNGAGDWGGHSTPPRE